MRIEQDQYFERLLRSFSKLYLVLNEPRNARRAVVSIIALHTGLLGYSAAVHSPTLNEPGHLVAGLSQWKFGRYDLYNVNPPLVKQVAALPVMIAGYKEDWSSFHNGAYPVFEIGEDFVAKNGERSFFLVTIARWACLPFSWIGACVCYFWARDLYGSLPGVLACALWCFSPSILAHASLITTDAPASALGLAACYLFWRWLRNPAWKQAVLAGIGLGIAELTKTTLILFYPLWPMLWAIHRWGNRTAVGFRRTGREAAMIVTCWGISLYILNLGYGFQDSFTPLKSFAFFSELFTDKARNQATYDDIAGNTQREMSSGNRFANSWIGNLPVPVARSYLMGIDTQQCDFESYGRPSYLAGKWQAHGWWYYYLYAALIKTPIGTLFFVALVGLLQPKRLWRRALTYRSQLASQGALSSRASSLYKGPASDKGQTMFLDELFLLIPLLTLFVGVSVKSGFSEHMRYILPCLPFLFVWICQSARIGVAIQERPILVFPRCLQRISLRHIFLSVALVWSITSSLWIYPHSLSYFNEIVGGPNRGPEHLIGSNIDWGQDLLYYKKWLVQRPRDLRDENVYLAYCGYFSPHYAHIQGMPPQISHMSENISKDNALAQISDSALVDLPRGLYAISVNFIQGYPWHIGDQRTGRIFFQNDDFRAFRQRKRDSQIGYSIYIYHLGNG